MAALLEQVGDLEGAREKLEYILRMDDSDSRRETYIKRLKQVNAKIQAERDEKKQLPGF